MRKASALVAVLLAAALLVSLAGCGSGDEAQAKKYLEQAYASTREIGKLEDQFYSKVQELMKNSEAITLESAQQVERIYREMKDLVGQINKKLQDSRLIYEKVLKLDGADDFKEYSRYRLEGLRLINRRYGLQQQYYDVLRQETIEYISGTLTDEKAKADQEKLAKLVDERKDIDRRLETLNEDAAKLDSDKLHLNLE